MAPFSLKNLLFILAIAGISIPVQAQNLVPNPSFEVFSSCPVNFGQGGPLPCTPWQSGSGGTTDYFNECALSSNVDVPTNFFGTEPAHTGVAYGGMYFRYVNFEWREYLQVQLTQPLVGGQLYALSFWISLADNNCGTDKLGVYFSQVPFVWPSGTHIPVTPQWEAQLGFISTSDGWQYIEGCYLAEGGEEWITIGNYYGDADTPIDPDCNNGNSSYYYLDDVSLTEATNIQNLDFDLGGPEEACDSFTIDPGLSNVSFFWSDGSHNPTLTVTETGTYSLTISSGCDSGEDEIDITINGGHAPVELGPHELDMCNGDEYTFSLDPDAGDYTWSDGSTDSDFSVTTSGTYGVTLDDHGCDVTMDEIVMNVIDPPLPVDLGPDTYVCLGDDIQFSFDPDLGDFHWSDGSTGSDFAIDEGGTYSLTISNVCGEETDEIVVADISPPEVEIGPDEINLCNGGFYEIQLDPTQGDYVWQDGAEGYEYTVSSPGIYHVFVLNECGTNSDDLIVHGINDPVFDLGPDISICGGQLPFFLTIANSGGTSFLWQNGSIDSVYEVTGAGAYSVTVSNECASLTDEILVEVENVNVDVALPADQTLCQGEFFVLQNSGATGDYVWQDGSTGATLTVNAPGTYSLTVTTACGQGADTVNINYTPPVTQPNLGPDFSLCPGQQFLLAPNIPGVNYLWQNGSSANSFLVTSAGTYYVQVSDLCTSASDTVIVTSNNSPPQLALPAQLNLCQGSSLTLDAGVNGVNYLWNDGSSNATLTVNTAGAYSLTVSNTCGADVDTVVVLDAGPQPLVSLGNDIDLCPGNSITITPAFSDVSNWLWGDGSNNPTYSVTGTELVTVEVSNACGTSADTLQSTLLPATPPLALGNDTAICPGNTVVLNISTPGVTIQWSDGSANTQLSVTSPGTYFATITNSCGSNSDSLAVSLLPGPPALSLGPDQSLCPGETVVINPGVANVNYLWQDGSSGTTFSATQAGSIVLEISNTCGTDRDTVEIIENSQGPQVNLGPDVLACEGDVVTLTSDISGVNYLWQDGSTNSNITTASSGTFVLEVSNNCGVDQDTVVVDIHGTPPDTELGPDTTLCSGTTLLLSSAADAETTIQWQDGSNNPTFLVNSPGTYSISESNHCGTNTDAIAVAFLNAPAIFDIGSDVVLCPGESITLNAPVTTDQILWQDGSSSPVIIADQAQTYSLLITNDCGTASDAFELSFDNNVPVVELGPESVWCPGEIIDLDVTQLFPATYAWNTGSTSPHLQISDAGFYTVTVSSQCADENDDITVTEDKTCFPVSIFIPTVFSPNDDLVNDFFTVNVNDGLQVVSMKGSIFDRWGNLIFTSDANPFSWDGRYHDAQMQPGVYVYQVNMHYLVNGIDIERDFYGDITLIR